MSHYVIIDGVLQLDSWANRRWAKRVAKAVPTNTEEKPDPVALPQEDRRTDWEIIEGLEEIAMSVSLKSVPRMPAENRD